MLIVDDNQAAAELLQELIALQDHQAVCAFSARQALELAEGGTEFVLAFIDLTLPDQPGAEVARQLRDRAQARGQRLVLVAVSGYGPNDPAGRQAAPYVDHFLQKPIDFDALDRLLAATAAAAA
ncbi:response regulator [Xenophilus sp. Marseille-Q4582]|uniref:response regulator n=1 Tax=Xenophilus sp. Marseille-Q4582 TaxID=2866600 RepID=UPI001CE42979|nr:response regulator [Xenophilus sp. Marseille-Q4582]